MNRQGLLNQQIEYSKTQELENFSKKWVKQFDSIEEQDKE